MKGVNNTFLTILIALVCIGAFMLFQFACIDFFALIGWQAQPPMLDKGIPNWGTYVTYVIVSCVLYPVFEELIFRYGVFGIARAFTRHTWIAVVSSAAIFSLYHWNFGQTVYQFIMGVIFAWIYFKTGNILYPILAHFINNFFVITYTFIAGSEILAYSWGAVSITSMIMLAIVGGAVIMGLVQHLKKENHERLFKRGK